MTIATVHIATPYVPVIARQPDEHSQVRKYLAPEDTAFLNARGAWGEPNTNIEAAFVSLAQRIYAEDPDNPDVVHPYAYYDGPIAQNNEAALASLGFMLQQPYLPQEAKATLQQSVDTLLVTRERPKEQMTRLLEEAKLVLSQRGVTGEAQVVEATHIIDAVLNNIRSFDKPGTSEEAAKFFQIYSGEVKSACELAVGMGRNPYPLSKQLHAAYKADPGSFDQKAQQVLESVQPQARTMAETLKAVLGPYAQISPPESGEARQEPQNAGQDQTQRKTAWQPV
ncbi:hypothetical protein AKI39_05960 [Bordetella sp. H567]|uniref:hypothetical protein n=1 Tax=Bordetella sp. H567 TaxID=1697043 RepID=UPI00081C8B4B|nr:hypothetical protein [Bordetella sp. H567]AOB30334.1 hypothetical protein AKI39_05960 [Bordetella sp. H567]